MSNELIQGIRTYSKYTASDDTSWDTYASPNTDVYKYQFCATPCHLLALQVKGKASNPLVVFYDGEPEFASGVIKWVVPVNTVSTHTQDHYPNITFPYGIYFATSLWCVIDTDSDSLHAYVNVNWGR